MLRPGDLVIDCGANVGDVTAPLAAKGASVHSFEPDPFAFGKLKARFAKSPNVTLHNAAVGLSDGKIRLHRAPGFDTQPKSKSVKSTVVEGGRGVSAAAEDAMDVDLIDFPVFLKKQIASHGEIAFLKMDIEGAELDILEAMEAERLFDHIRCTVAETHEKKFSDLRPRFRALKDRIAKTYNSNHVNLDWI